MSIQQSIFDTKDDASYDFFTSIYVSFLNRCKKLLHSNHFILEQKNINIDDIIVLIEKMSIDYVENHEEQLIFILKEMCSMVETNNIIIDNIEEDKIYNILKENISNDIAILFTLLTKANMDLAIRLLEEDIPEGYTINKTKSDIYSDKIEVKLVQVRDVEEEHNLDNQEFYNSECQYEENNIEDKCNNELEVYKENKNKREKLLSELEEVNKNIKDFQIKYMEEKIEKRVGKEKFSKLPVIVFGKIGNKDLYAEFSILYIGNGEFKENKILWSDYKERTKEEFIDQFICYDIEEFDFITQKNKDVEIIELVRKKNDLQQKLLG